MTSEFEEWCGYTHFWGRRKAVSFYDKPWKDAKGNDCVIRTRVCKRHLRQLQQGHYITVSEVIDR